MTRGNTGLGNGIARRTLDRDEVLARRDRVRSDAPSAARTAELKRIQSQLRSIENRSVRR